MLRFDLGMILIATDEFSAGNKLGQGGFGSVYKGILPSGQEIAVKRLAGGSGQGDLEFKNEEMERFLFKSMSLIQVLITLYSVSLGTTNYEHKRWLLTWGVRCIIIEGVARGLLYLHEDSLLDQSLESLRHLQSLLYLTLLLQHQGPQT
ncbi:hypothetical protein HID58_052015 [Brassica napus]|uniref:Protein kinase domain-containing protein n=1 Tax=Brassica napus TaxID=3708 RepID=A0ABQ8AAL1_BRANA|nr:hypothetical protein HID58_052015 [Brassica napus]